MKINIIEAQKIICSNPNGINNYFGWPSVCRLQDGSLMAVASGFRKAHICPFGKLVAIRSYDNGASWTAPEVIIDTPLDDRDGGVMTFGEKGVIATSFNNTPDFQRKQCQVRTSYAYAYIDEIEKHDWKKYLGSTVAVSEDGGKTFKGPYLMPVSSPHGPCELSDGRILYVGRLYDQSNVPASLACYIITPDGKSELLSRISDVAETDLLSCEPHAIQLKSGRIVVHIRVQKKSDSKRKENIFTIYQSVSDDMGKTFSEPIQILSDEGGAPAHLIEHSSGMLVSVYGYRSAPYGIRAMFSRDGGESWDTDNIIADTEVSPDLGYPASAELPNGDILTVFYSREKLGGASVIKQMIWNFREE